MQHLPEILKLVEGGLQRDPVKVSRYVELLASKLDAEGDAASAALLRKLIQGVKSNGLHAAEFGVKTAIPVDTESRVSLADVSHPTPTDSPLVVSEHVQAALDDFILGYRRHDVLVNAGLSGPGHILLYGPPGCGKTQAARYIAAALNLPLVTARLDGLVSSFLGSTAKNLRALFDFVDKTPCVLFLDEFDAVAKMRDDPHELGELKRVVNSLLQNIDFLPSGTAVVAATNHAHLLDSAVWRRFEFHVLFELPDEEARQRLFDLYLPGRARAPEELKILAVASSGLTPADIRRTCELLARELALTNRKRFELRDAMRALILYASRSRADDEGALVWPEALDDQIVALRAKSPTVFTFDVISQVLGVSKGKVHNVLKARR